MGYNVSYLCRIKFKFKRRNCIMIRKISSSDYLKRLDNMNGEERQAYRERVGKWLLDKKTLAVMLRSVEPNAQLQNAPQCSTGWNDAECQAFDEGAVLLTAVMHQAETWLPDMLYVKSAKRCIRRMHEILKGVCESEAMEIVTKQSADKKLKEEPAEGTAKATQAVGKGSQTKTTIKMGGANTVAPDAKSTTVTELQPVRPKHIDQYVHLLPQKTQERAAQVKDLLHELDSSREKMRLLMDDETASAADREAWAKKATSIDNKIRKIYDELDAEWDKLVKSGRVVVDDLGNARVVESVGGQVPGSANSQDGSARDLSPDRLTELTSEQRKQRKALRKWLLDTRYGKGDKLKDYQKRWQEKFKEYAALDGTAYTDEKILAAAKHYGIEIKK